MDSSPFEEKPTSGHHQRDPFASPLPQSRNSRPPQPPVAGRLLPTYDLISGEAGTPSRSSPIPFSPIVLRSPKGAPQSSNIAVNPAATADISNEALRSELASTRYELDVLREERELEKVQHEQELRALEAKAEEQAKRVDTVETEKRFLLEKQTEQAEITKKAKAAAAAAKQNFERQIRMLKTEIANWKETVTDKQDEIDSEHRKHRSEMSERDGTIRVLEQSLEELKAELESKNDVLAETHKKLSEKDEEVQELETELLKMRTHAGDADTLRILQRELSEQVNHIKNLEGTNRRQASELQHVRDSLRSLELVEEEKRTLESKVKILEDLRSELTSAQVRVSVLEDERRSWESYFESEGLEFDSPEALAKALVEERLDKAALLEKIGRTNPEVTQKDGIIMQLQGSLAQTEKDFRELQERLAKDIKARQRLERQRALALREAEFLREQLKSFSSEETIYMQGNFDEQKSQRIQELEQLLEEYKAEVEELRQAAQTRGSETSSVSSHKRPIDDSDDQRIGQLVRRNRQLQEDIEQLQRKNAVAEKDVQALQARIKSMSDTSVRILELRDNPTSRDQAIKASQLTALKEENAALLAQLEGKRVRSVPISTLENAREDTKSMERVVAEKEKRMTRLKEIWTSKSNEFREAVYSLLGWKLDFMANGRVRVTHMFGRNGDQSIEFDGERGTMKISGGPDSMFAKEIRNQCQFWMPRQNIPCLLASILLEQYEKTTRAQI